MADVMLGKRGTSIDVREAQRGASTAWRRECRTQEDRSTAGREERCGVVEIGPDRRFYSHTVDACSSQYSLVAVTALYSGT
ncbi:N-methyl-L-tryptophan oxidase [Dirofilaria immitis]